MTCLFMWHFAGGKIQEKVALDLNRIIKQLNNFKLSFNSITTDFPKYTYKSVASFLVMMLA